MKKSYYFFLSIMIWMALFSCNSSDKSNLIINKWELTELEIIDTTKYFNQIKKSIHDKYDNTNIPPEQIEQIIKMSINLTREMTTSNYKEIPEASIFKLRDDGKMLDYYGKVIGQYSISLDSKKLTFINENNVESVSQIESLTKNKLVTLDDFRKTYKAIK